MLPGVLLWCAAGLAPDGGQEEDAAREACCFYRKNQTIALVTLNSGDPDTDLMLAGARQAAKELGVRLREHPFLRNYQDAVAAFPQAAAAAQGVIVNAGRADRAFIQVVQAAKKPLFTTLSPEVVRKALPRAIQHLGPSDSEVAAHAAGLLPQGGAPGQRVLCLVDIAGSPAEQARCKAIVDAGGVVYKLFAESQDIEEAREALGRELQREPRVTGCFAASAGAARVVGPALAALRAAGVPRPRSVAYGLSESLWGGGTMLFDRVMDPGAWGAGYMAVHSLLVYLHTGNALPVVAGKVPHVLTGPTVHTPADFDQRPRLRCMAQHLQIAFCPEAFPAASAGAPDCPCVNRTRDIRIALNQHQGGQVSIFWTVLEAAVDHFLLGFAGDPPVVDFSKGGKGETYDAKGQAENLDGQLQHRPDALGVAVPEQVIADVAVTAGQRTKAGVYWTYNAGWDTRTWGRLTNNSGYPVHFGQDEYQAGLAVGHALSQEGNNPAVCIIQHSGDHLLQRCQGFSDSYAGEVYMLHTDREQIFVEAVDSIAEFLSTHPRHTTAFALGPIPLNALLAAADQVGVDLTDYVIATMDFDPNIAQAIEEGTLQLAVHQQQYLQGYHTLMGLYVGALTHGWIQHRSIVATGPLIVTAELVKRFSCELPHRYPLCELPEEQPVIVSGTSELPVWIWPLVAIGGILVIAFPPVMWHLSSNWRRIRKLHSRETIAVNCAESIAAMRLEEVAYIKEIPNPDRIQRAFINIIAVLTEYRAFLPKSLLVRDDDDTDESTPAREWTSPSGARQSSASRVSDQRSRSNPLVPGGANGLQVNPRGSDSSSRASSTAGSQASGSTASGGSSPRRIRVRAASPNLHRSGACVDGHVVRKMVYVLWAGRARTHDMLGRGSSISADPFSKIISACLPAVEAARGVVDHLSGDRVVASFGAVRNCGDQMLVARCALAMAAALSQTSEDGVGGHVGSEKGHAYVGTLGNAMTRKHTVLSHVANVAYACSRIARQYSAPVVVGPRLRGDTAAQVLYWALCVYHSMKLSPAKAPHTIVLYEMVGLRPEQAADEWMYQLARQQQGDPYSATNAALEVIARSAAPPVSRPTSPGGGAGIDRAALQRRFEQDGPCTSVPVDVAF